MLHFLQLGLARTKLLLMQYLSQRQSLAQVSKHIIHGILLVDWTIS